MARFEFGVATAADDAELRAILATTPMPGRISVSFRREPSFFSAAAVEGPFHQVVVCRDQHHNRIAGFGCRSVRQRYVNGKPTPVGYLSGLRALPEYRSRGLVARGYRYLRHLHGDGKAEVYLTTIAEGNQPALSTLVGARAGLPGYLFAGRYHTVVIPLSRRVHRLRCSRIGFEVRPATLDDRERLVAFFRSVGPGRQFFPCLTAADLFEPACAFRDLAPDDLWLATRSGEIIGTLGAWNQQSFRQSIVEGYGWLPHVLRPAYNAWARLAARPRLARIGEPLHYLTAALPTVSDNDARVFGALLKALLAGASGGDADYLLMGLHETDPLLPLARRWGKQSYVTRMYLVSWDGGERRSSFDGRPYYLELGFL